MTTFPTTCSQIVDGKPCPNPPLVRYTWPGRDEVGACLEHAAKAQEVAMALGMYLQMIPLPKESE